LPFSSYPSLLPPSRLSSTYSAEEEKINPWINIFTQYLYTRIYLLVLQ
jgi:hypothetical protein